MVSWWVREESHLDESRLQPLPPIDCRSPRWPVLRQEGQACGTGGQELNDPTSPPSSVGFDASSPVRVLSDGACTSDAAFELRLAGLWGASVALSCEGPGDGSDDGCSEECECPVFHCLSPLVADRIQDTVVPKLYQSREPESAIFSGSQFPRCLRSSRFIERSTQFLLRRGIG